MSNIVDNEVQNSLQGLEMAQQRLRMLQEAANMIVSEVGVEPSKCLIAPNRTYLGLHFYAGGSRYHVVNVYFEDGKVKCLEGVGTSWSWSSPGQAIQTVRAFLDAP